MSVNHPRTVTGDAAQGAGGSWGWWAAGLAGAAAGYALVRVTQAKAQAETQALLGDRKVVILGGGFGGAQAALDLAKALPTTEDRQVILIDENNYLLFTPMLTEVAAGQVDARHIVSPLRRLSPDVTFMQGHVELVDLAAKRVTFSMGSDDGAIPPATRTVDADFLILALGSVTNFHHVPGMEEHALTMKSVEDALGINNRVLALLERADAEPDLDTRRDLLTIVVAGGGFSGVETMASVNDFIRYAVRHYPSLSADDVRTILVHPKDHLLPELGPGLGDYSQRKLEERGVEVRLNCRVEGAGRSHIELAGGERIPTYCIIWTAGVTPHPVVKTLPCERGPHGGVITDAGFAVPGHTGVWAIGDCAEIPREGGQTYAPTAQNAVREGSHVAANLLAVVRGEEPQPFTFEPFGELALVGRRSGVGEMFGVRFSGFLAWFLWRSVYLFKMPDMEDRVRIGIDWFLDFFLGREISEFTMLGVQKGTHPTPKASAPGAASGQGE